jgi:glucokinase
MSSKLTVGIDLGGTQVRAALVSTGRILARESRPTNANDGPEGVLKQFWMLVTEVCTGHSKAALQGIGVCAPGPLDSTTGEIIEIPTLPRWEGFRLREAIQKQFDLPVVIENDGIAAAYGEWQFGSGRGHDHMVYATISTGVGGGVVVDGRLMRGRRGMGGHVGHFRMAEDGPRCSCGAIGCFEAFASGTALGIRAQAKADEHPLSYLGRVIGDVRARHVVEGARSGDEVCRALIDEEAEYLGIGFTGLIHLFSPDLIVMGGGVSQGFELMSERIRAVIDRNAMGPFKSVPVVPAHLGDSSGLLGIAALAQFG